MVDFIVKVAYILEEFLESLVDEHQANKPLSYDAEPNE